MAELVAYPTARLTGAWSLGDPGLGGTALNYVDGIDEEGMVEWLDYGGVSNNVFDVYEVDISGLPAGALITSARLEFSYRKNSQGAFRLVPLGISADGLTLSYGPTETYVYGTWNTDITIEHPYRFALADGSLFSDYTRLGFYVKHINGENDAADEHRLYWGRLRIQYDTGLPAGALTVPVDTSSVNFLDTVEWTYSQGDGRPQTHYRVKIYDQADPDILDAPDNGGTALFDSGKVSSSNARVVTPGLSFDAGNYRVFLKVWSTSTTGAATESLWDDHDFTVNAGSPPVVPEGVTATWDDTTGLASVRVAPNIDGGGTNVEIERSTSGGDWELIATLPNPGWTAGDRFTVEFEDDPGFHKLVVYRVRNSPTDLSPSSSWISPAVLSTTSAQWWMIDSGDPVIRFNPRVQSYSVSQRRVTSKTQLRDRAVVATTGPLSDEIQLTILTLSQSERLALEVMLDLSRPIRLVDILGREWFVEVDSDIGSSMQRMAPDSSENTGLRDAHVYSVTFVEVADPG